MTCFLTRRWCTLLNVNVCTRVCTYSSVYFYTQPCQNMWINVRWSIRSHATASVSCCDSHRPAVPPCMPLHPRRWESWRKYVEIVRIGYHGYSMPRQLDIARSKSVIETYWNWSSNAQEPLAGASAAAPPLRCPWHGTWWGASNMENPVSTGGGAFPCGSLSECMSHR